MTRFYLTVVYAFLSFFLFSGSCLSVRNNPLITLGLVDNGFWNEKGAIYLEAPFHTTEKRDETEKFIGAKYREYLSKKIFLELPYEDVKNSVAIKIEQEFQVYSESGFVGSYRIDKFVVLVNACGGSDYIYAKLKGKVEELSGKNVVAKLVDQGEPTKKINIIFPRKLDQPDKERIEQILSIKSANPKEQIRKFLNRVASDRSSKLPELKLKYNAFNYRKPKDRQTHIMINATWSCKSPELQPDTGFYFTNTFLVSKTGKIIELEPIKLTHGADLDIPTILFGVDFNDSTEFAWIIKHELWEGSAVVITRWAGKKRVYLYIGNYFGC